MKILIVEPGNPITAVLMNIEEDDICIEDATQYILACDLLTYIKTIDSLDSIIMDGTGIGYPLYEFIKDQCKNIATFAFLKLYDKTIALWSID